MTKAKAKATAMPWVYDDGGRAAAGFTGTTGDCVCRAIAIATGDPYAAVYAALNQWARIERPRRGRRSSARTGVKTPTIRRYLHARGWTWTPTVTIGSGCVVHVRPGEVPMTGRVILSLSKHLTVVVDGVVHDTHDPSRDGFRCVYGYWLPPSHVGPTTAVTGATRRITLD